MCAMFTFKSLLRLTKQSQITLNFSFCRYSGHAGKFSEILGSQNVLTSDIEAYNTDWLNTHTGNTPKLFSLLAHCLLDLGRSEVVLFPRNTFDVSNVLKYCYSNDIKCVVQSGNTSLVSGSVPVDNEVIISMTKMNRIIEFDDNSGILQCESGCVLQNLEDFVTEKNRIIPYDLGSKGSCLIGGNLATNAGGLRLVKYGPLHGTVLGIEVVLPNGEIINLMSKMRKDNTGYHLRHLFIGKS